MSKTIYAMAFLVMAAYACDPWIEDCTKKDDLPAQGEGWYYLHGIVAFCQAIYMPILLGIEWTNLNLYGTIVLSVSWGVAGLNLIGYLPVGIVWAMTAAGSSTDMYQNYAGWLHASNIYGYIMAVLNIGWYVVLLLQSFFPIFSDFSTLAVLLVPNYYAVIAGAATEVVLQTLFSISYPASRDLMQCWGTDFPENGVCTWD